MTQVQASFHQPLPRFEYIETYRITAPGPSTDIFDPPKGWEPRRAQLFAQEFWRYRNSNAFGSNLNCWLPAVEFHSFRLTREADVVRAAALYLLHPVHLALQALPLPRLICQSEQVHGATARSDISWKYKDRQNQWRTLAVLEFKATGMLVKQEFLEAATNSQRSSKELVDSAYVLRQRKDNSWFGDGARPLTQQMIKYSERAEVDLVAIFDWKSMFVLDFGSRDEGRYQLAKGTWFAEDDGNTARPETFRSVLFGMLIEALRRNGVIL